MNNTLLHHDNTVSPSLSLPLPSLSSQNALVVKVPQLPVTIYNGSNVISQVKIRVTAGKGDRTGREPLRSNLSDFSYVKQGEREEGGREGGREG